MVAVAVVVVSMCQGRGEARHHLVNNQMVEILKFVGYAKGAFSVCPPPKFTWRAHRIFVIFEPVAKTVRSTVRGQLYSNRLRSVCHAHKYVLYRIECIRKVLRMPYWLPYVHAKHTDYVWLHLHSSKLHLRLTSGSKKEEQRAEPRTRNCCSCVRDQPFRLLFWMRIQRSPQHSHSLTTNIDPDPQ